MLTTYRKVNQPKKDCAEPILLSDETIAERKEKVLNRMKAAGLDQLVIYNDVEHAGNFMYLVGYFTRFEEGLLVLNADGSAKLVLGNESLNKADKARIKADPILTSLFSLPNQPDYSEKSLVELLKDAGVKAGGKV